MLLTVNLIIFAIWNHTLCVTMVNIQYKMLTWKYEDNPELVGPIATEA
jgi:hypothetical protein